MKKHLLISFLLGIIYWISGIVYELEIGQDFVILLLYLTGILFPLSSVDFSRKSKLDIFKYFVCANAIYYLALLGWMYNDHTYHSIFVGAFIGSVLFQIMTKYFFKANTSWTIICLIGVLSIFAFVPFQFDWGSGKLGFGVFLWMILNATVVSRSTTANS
jgi:hypothetical protein